MASAPRCFAGYAQQKSCSKLNLRVNPSLKGNRDEHDTEQTLVPDRHSGVKRCGLHLQLYAATDRLVIESGDSAQSRQQASMEKEQWNDTRSLRQKVNKRAEKEWDKADVAFDAQDNCQKSANVNAYWEPNTLRCLDRRTGRAINP